MPFIGSRWVPGPGEPQQAPTRVGSRVTSAPAPAPSQPAPWQEQAAAAALPSPGYSLKPVPTGIRYDPGTGMDQITTEPSQPEPTPAAPAQPAQNWTSAQREQFKNQWMGTGTDVAGQNALLAQQGLRPDQAGRVTLPTGEQLDLRIGAKSGRNLAGWTRYLGANAVKRGQAGGGFNPAGGGRVGGGIGGSLGTGGIGGQGAIGGIGGRQDFGGGVREAIMRMLGQKELPDQAALEAQARPQLNELQRQAQQTRAQMAERLAQQGLQLSDADIAGLGEATGQQRSQLMAQVATRELGARRQQIAEALQLGERTMGRDQQMAMQRELAALDAELRRMGITSQERIAGQGLAAQERMQQAGFGFQGQMADWQAEQAERDRELRRQGWAIGGGG